MKKFILFLAVSAFMFVSCDNKEKVFDRNLNESYKEMGKVLDYGLEMSYKIQNTWNNAIDQRVDHHGNYCSDSWAAVEILLDEYKTDGNVDSLKAHQERMEETAELLRNPPESRRNCYNDYVDLIAEINNLARMATKPSGSLFAYSMQRKEVLNNISSKLYQFKIKYGNQLYIHHLLE